MYVQKNLKKRKQTEESKKTFIDKFEWKKETRLESF